MAIYKEELVGLVPAIDVVGWFERNKVTKENIPKNLGKFSKLEITDNPIVMIAKLKK